MVKVFIDSDEWYPVYSVIRVQEGDTDHSDWLSQSRMFEMSEEDIAFFENAEETFRETQKRLAKMPTGDE